jgi:two-component system chemotaxis sensor kinase CheA
MGGRASLAEKLLAAYVEELEIHVAALNDDLLALERAGLGEGSDERLHALFRTIHTIKGASRAAGATSVEQTSHAFEEILARLRERSLAADPALYELLFAVTDAIAETGERLRRGEGEGGALPGLLGRLTTQGQRSAEVGGAASRASDGANAAYADGSALRFPTTGPEGAPLSTAPTAPPPFTTATTGSPALRLAPERIDELIAKTRELLASHGRLRERYAELEAFQQSLSLTLRGARSPRRVVIRGERRATTAPDETSVGGSILKDGRRQQEARLLASLERTLAAARDDDRRLALDLAAVDATARALRMVAFGELLPGLERVVRDLAASSGKQIELVVAGSDVQLDRAVLDGLRPVLLHLVRNAVDHGLETPPVRTGQGKPAIGTLRLSAHHRGAEIVITIEDDGRGIDREAVRSQLARRGLPVPTRDEDVLRTIFEAGLSTARLITDLSGRGVGLDVVKRGVEALHGTIDLRSLAGTGTTFSLVVPLTATALRGLLVRVRRQTFVVPGTAVLRLLRAARSDVVSVGGLETIRVEGAPVTLVALADVLGASEPTVLGDRKLPAVVVLVEGARIALLVDEVLEERDVYVQPLGRRLRGAPSVAGASVLADGTLALVLNVAEVVARSRTRLRAGLVRRADEPTAASARRREILLVDDSLTTRTLERSILEAAGYSVRSAGDGEEALRLLHEHGADLVVSDVEMPLLDGFALTARIRATPRFNALPVVLLTALGSDTDRQRGLDVGADAYLVKGAFDQQNLLETITQLL